jgi:hypothetical protein
MELKEVSKMRTVFCVVCSCAIAISCFASMSHGAASIVVNGGSSKPKTKSKTNTAQNKIKLIVDPIGVGEFQLDVQFDPANLEFVGFEVLGDYNFLSIDLTKLAQGLVADLHGVYAKGGVVFTEGVPSTYPPLEEGVDIFEITFRSKTGLPITQTEVFRIAPPPDQQPVLTQGDFIKYVGDGGTVTTSDPLPEIVITPEPGIALSLLSLILIGLMRRPRAILN